MAGCMAHEREGYISTSGLKSDLIIVFLDPDFLCDAGISAIRPKISVILRIFSLRKRPYFHFRSNIWCHHRDPRPRFPSRRENFGDSAVNKRYIAYFYCACAKRPYFHFRSKIWYTIVFLDPDLLWDSEISAIRPKISVILRISHCACAKRQYFHFRSKI